MDDSYHRLDDPAATPELFRLASPSDEAKALARSPEAEGQPPRALVNRLAAEGQFPDAVKLLALALPRREAVWWACRCCRESLSEDEPPANFSALEAAECWAAEPSENHRRASHAAADASGLEAPGGCAAMAAFFSGGSIAPPSAPDVPPAPHLTAHLASGGVMLAAVRSRPEHASERYRAFLALGFAVADGTDRPPEAAPLASPTPGRSASSRPPSDRREQDPPRPPMPDPSPSPSHGQSARPKDPSPPPSRRWDEWE